MTRRPRTVVIVLLVTLVAGATLWALRDPVWIGGYTHGLRPTEVDDTGTPFQWTEGQASFFVPTSSTSVEFALSTYPTGRTRVWVSIDGALADERQIGEEWQTVRLPLATPTSRRYRRIDLRVARAWGEERLGVRLTGLRY